MSFWKKLGIWNVITGKTSEERTLGALLALSEQKKEQNKNKYTKKSCSWNECLNCHSIISEGLEECPNCGMKFRKSLNSNGHNNTEINIYDKDGNIININTLKKQKKKYYKAGVNIDPGDYFFFSAQNKGLYIIGSGQIDGASDMYESLDDEKYCITGVFLRLYVTDSLFVDNGFLINANLVSEVEYINPNGLYSYRVGTDLPKGNYSFKLYDENYSAYFSCYYGPRTGRDSEKVESWLSKTTELEMKDGFVIYLDRNIYIDKIVNTKKRNVNKLFDNIITKNNLDFSHIKIYSEGQYFIGIDIRPNEYLFYSPTGEGHFSMTKDPNGEDIVEIENNIMSCFVNLLKGLYIYIQNGYLIETAKLKSLEYKKILGKTTYRVGIDIPEGIYKIKSHDDSSYYCIYNHAFDINTDIISNGIFKGKKYVELKNENYFTIDKDISIVERKKLPNDDKNLLNKQEITDKNKEENRIHECFKNYANKKEVKFDNGNIIEIKYKPYLSYDSRKDEREELLTYYRKLFLNKTFNKRKIINVNMYKYNNIFLIMFDAECNDCGRVCRFTAPDKVHFCKCNGIRHSDWSIIKEINLYSTFSDFTKNANFKPNERYFIIDPNKKITFNNVFKGTYNEYSKYKKNIITTDAMCLNCGTKVEKNSQCPICGAIVYRKNDIRYELISKRLYEKQDIDNSWEKNLTPYEVNYYYNDTDMFFVQINPGMNLKYYYLDHDKLCRMGLYNVKYIDNTYLIADYLFYIYKYGLVKFENIYMSYKNELFSPIVKYYIGKEKVNPESKLLNTKNMTKLKLIYFTKDENNKKYTLNAYENNELINKVENIINVLQKITDKRLVLELDNKQKKYYDIDYNELIDTDFNGKIGIYDFESLNTNIDYNFKTTFLPRNIESLLKVLIKEDNTKIKSIYINKSIYKDNQILFKYLQDNFRLELLENEIENDKSENYVAKISRTNKDAISFIEYVITKSKSKEARNTINYLIYGMPLKYIIASAFSNLTIKEKLCDLIKKDIILITNPIKKENLINEIYMRYISENDNYTKIFRKLMNKYKTDEFGLIMIILYKYGEELAFDLPSIENVKYDVSEYTIGVINNSNNDKNKRLYDDIYLSLDIEKIKWKSEFTMFKLIKSYFPDAIYQYRFKDLGQQSLDVYVPSIKIAFEYQGQQHYEPIEVFGGWQHFEKQKENDKQKREICKNNGIDLIEWKYTENINKFVLDQKLSEYKEKVEELYEYNE